MRFTAPQAMPLTGGPRRTLLRPVGIVTAVFVVAVGCAERPVPPARSPYDVPRRLSEFGLFTADPRQQRPAAGVVPYGVNTPLFSDYTVKHRFVRLPHGSAAKYHADETFEFPVGTILVKTFAQWLDRRDPSAGERLIETRILMHQPQGWVGLPYVWNDQQTEAHLALGGDVQPVRWIHDDGSYRTNDYIIPNANQCKGCHRERGPVAPIGTKARQLNRAFAYAEGTQNQLTYWSDAGILDGAPPPDESPRLAQWDAPHTGSTAQRARAWLEANCAHCHNPDGPANNTGLDLFASQSDPRAYGVYRTPVAAGIGTGGRTFDIVPGKPDESILLHRIASTDPQVMMPELGKRLVHVEGVQLIRRWIAEMDANDGRATRQHSSVAR